MERVYKAALALGTANQLTNILRDVGEDAKERNRIYVPMEELRQFGITEEEVRAEEGRRGGEVRQERGEGAAWVGENSVHDRALTEGEEAGHGGIVTDEAARIQHFRWSCALDGRLWGGEALVQHCLPILGPPPHAQAVAHRPALALIPLP